jgi:hypothetical protein
LGALLTGGTQTLSVTFVPANATDYASVKTSVSLVVNQPAALTSPAPGSTLTSSSQSFGWSSSADVTAFMFHLGTKGVGSCDLKILGSTTATSVNVTGIPTDGTTLFARLYMRVNGVWLYVDYTYTEAGTATPTELTSPTPGSTLSGSSQTFIWTPGGGATAFMLYLGTKGAGTDDLDFQGSTAATQVTVTVPANGVTVYARLYSRVGGAWQYADYTFTEAGTPVPAALTSPAPGSKLTSVSASFIWTPGRGVAGYMFHLGTKGAGSGDLCLQGVTTATSVHVTVPANGVTLYARLYSQLGGVWEYSDYTFTEPGTPAPAALTSPAAGSRLSGASQVFTWSSGTGVTVYMFRLGTKGAGSSDLLLMGSTTATSSPSVTVPTDGVPLYARLYSEISGVWQFTDCTFTASGTPVPAALTSPTVGSTLSSSSVTFNWSSGSGVTAYMFHLGTKGAGSDDLCLMNPTTATTSGSVTVPTNGLTVYARLYSEIGGVWQHADYTFTESGTPVPAALTSPTPGSTLSGTSVTFTWSSGRGVTAYMFHLGTKGAGSDDLRLMNTTTATTTGSVTVPAFGLTLYARLYSEIAGVWQFTDYTFTESGTTAPGALTSPTPGSTFSGTSATFTWSSGTGVTAYMFHLGTKGVGSDDLCLIGSTTATTSGSVSVPAYGVTVYARLYSEIAGVWQHTDYVFTESGSPVLAALVSPTPSSTFSGASQTFTWSSGGGVTAYMLWVGTKRIGSNNLYVLYPTTATSSGSVTVPTNGVTVYVRLFSLISGAWRSADYTYTAQ